MMYHYLIWQKQNKPNLVCELNYLLYLLALTCSVAATVAFSKSLFHEISKTCDFSHSLVCILYIRNERYYLMGKQHNHARIKNRGWRWNCELTNWIIFSLLDRTRMYMKWCKFLFFSSVLSCMSRKNFMLWRT